MPGQSWARKAALEARLEPEPSLGSCRTGCVSTFVWPGESLRHASDPVTSSEPGTLESCLLPRATSPTRKERGSLGFHHKGSPWDGSVFSCAVTLRLCCSEGHLAGPCWEPPLPLHVHPLQPQIPRAVSKGGWRQSPACSVLTTCTRLGPPVSTAQPQV